MTRCRVIPRQRAERDLDDAIDYYFDEGGADSAVRFIDAVESAFHHLAAHPESGSPRYATDLDLPGLRSWSLRQFPHLIFYIVNGDVLDVWRVLHAKRDIPESLTTGQ